MKGKTIKRYLFIRFFIAITIPFIVIAILVNTSLKSELQDKYYNQMTTNTLVLEEDLNTKLNEFEILMTQIQSNITSAYILPDRFELYTQSTRNNYDNILRIDVLDSEKNIILTTPKRSDFIGLDQSRIFTDPVDGSVYWSDIFLSRITGKPSVFCAVKASDYYFVIYIDMSYFDDVITKYQYKDMDVRVSGAGNLEVASSFTFVPRNKEELFTKEGLIFSSITDDLKNKHITSSYRIPRNNWVIELSVLSSVVDQEVRSVNVLLLFAYVIALIISLIFNIQVVKSLMKPINQLTKNSVLLGNGDFNIATDYSFKELNDLSDNFVAMAEKIQLRNDELGQFVYIASHDLQEPLRMVTSYIQIIQRKFESEFNEDDRKYFNYVVDGASRMKLLIQDLLKYSRAGNKYNYIKVDLNVLIKRVEQDLEITLENEMGRLEYGLLPIITADQVMLQQVFQNIISNGIKYHSHENPVITITWKDDPDFWSFRISDNGIGIEEEYFDSIFKVFTRLHTKELYSGTGIGLAICKKVIENHGGTINVDSKVNEGSTFEFTIRKDILNEFN